MPWRYTVEQRIAHFWARVRIAGPDECWPWLGKKRGGYGRVLVEGRYVQAHRYAHELAHGPMASELEAAHKCDNRGCCNPGHVFPATPLENTRDCIQKGRARKAMGLRRRAKLTDDQVYAIRNAYVPRRVSQPILARRYNVSRSVIEAVLLGKTYKVHNTTAEGN